MFAPESFFECGLKIICTLGKLWKNDLVMSSVVFYRSDVLHESVSFLIPSLALLLI